MQIFRYYEIRVNEFTLSKNIINGNIKILIKIFVFIFTYLEKSTIILYS